MIYLLPEFAWMNTEQRAHADKTYVYRVYSKGIALLRVGHPADTFRVIMKGRVKMTIPGPDGSEALIGFLGPGDMIGELSLLISGGIGVAHGVTQEETFCAELTLQNYQNALNDSQDFSRYVAGHIATKLREAHRRISSLTTSSARERICNVLIECADLLDDQYVVSHPMSQREIAQMAGVTREVVNRYFREFTMAGWLQIKDRRIHIVRDILEAVGSVVKPRH